MKKSLSCCLKGLTVSAVMLFSASSWAESIRIYNWTDYIPSDLIAEFTRETGIDVNYSTFESNEEMYSKLKLLKNTGYDLVFPSSYYIGKMAKEGMLEKIDHSKLSNFNQIPANLLHKDFDPNNDYSLPYVYGLTGIGVNKSVIDPAKITGWADLWHPEYKGQVLLTADAREVFHIALLLDGKSPNTQNEEEIKAAYERLTKLLPNVATFNSDTPELPYIQGEVDLGMIWNGSAYMAKRENPDIEFIYPKEGAIFWMDNYAIPKGSQHVEAAHKFIDFMLRPEHAKVIIERMGYSMPNEGVKALLKPEDVANPLLFPPESEVKKGVFQADVGDAVDIYEKYWNRLKTDN
ncbi:extracellular solute-binding protein [Bisgaard Taxon 10/6]|uniref:extracellular solute-binding protein n=1 Tax=Exercitatus varius TaxID=67857 RepID=UPI00294AA2DD|nr:extracellular solute-binding protein [Exercitatus varius]MDG2952518.1 extracellular solute-binding protein [Exercitatus varius]MDG2955951.1 extracellular solute-binding protein [Exercitatus varius]MDG2964588.1 extracellular solute-binding protein [Exercitatus varius]